MIETQGRVTCAQGTREYCIIAVTHKELQFYTLKQLELVKTLSILQPATTLCLLNEKTLVYGLGDEGYGCIFIKDDFRMFESNSGKEKYKRSVAKTTLLPTFGHDGFIWKVGGYTALTGGYTKKS